MKCTNPKCGKEFNPHDNAELGHYSGDAVEVKTSCPHCEEAYYTFTIETWQREAHADALIEHTRNS